MDIEVTDITLEEQDSQLLGENETMESEAETETSTLEIMNTEVSMSLEAESVEEEIEITVTPPSPIPPPEKEPALATAQDKITLKRTEQIELVKKSAEYKLYIEEIPVDQRGPPKEHPRTPEPSKKCSNRVWEGLVKDWRRSLGHWTPKKDEPSAGIIETSKTTPVTATASSATAAAPTPKKAKITFDSESASEEANVELARRQKHISNMKQTAGYQNYLKVVPVEKRQPGEHPMTPDPKRKYSSKKDWLNEIQVWREGLAKYQPDWEEVMSIKTSDETSSPIGEKTESSKEPEKSMKAIRKPIIYDLGPDEEVNELVVLKEKALAAAAATAAAKAPAVTSAAAIVDDDVMVLDEYPGKLVGTKTGLAHRLGDGVVKKDARQRIYGLSAIPKAGHLVSTLRNSRSISPPRRSDRRRRRSRSGSSSSRSRTRSPRRRTSGDRQVDRFNNSYPQQSFTNYQAPQSSPFMPIVSVPPPGLPSIGISPWSAPPPHLRQALPPPAPTISAGNHYPPQPDFHQPPSRSVIQSQMPPQSTHHSSIATMLPQPAPTQSKGLDFRMISMMNPGEEMLRYIQSKSYDYARELDAKHPDFRRMIGRTVLNQLTPPDGSQKVLPCGPFNQDDSCAFRGLANLCHAGPSGLSIHACSLCYFCLGGLFNFHRHTSCPLLTML